jgi:hypothetical protein
LKVISILLFLIILLHVIVEKAKACKNAGVNGEPPWSTITDVCTVYPTDSYTIIKNRENS